MNIENGTAILTETYNFCKNENLLGPIILGDWNSRHPFWGDKVDNKYGKILSDYCADHQFSIISPHYPTFVSAQNNGSSVIDFCITQQSCSDLISNARVIEDTEFFSGAPQQGHWPVIFDLDLPVKCDNPKRCVLNYKMADWEDISIQLEEMVVKNMDSMIREAPTKALVTFMDLVKEICEKTIPRKTVCKYSKPYWTKKLTYLSNKLKEARKKYRLQCNPENKNIVDLAKKKLKREINLNNTRWTQNGIMQMNEGNAKTFFDNIRKFNGSMSSNNVGVLRHEGKTIDKDVQKASVFQSVFFDGAHLTGKLFDEAFYEKTKNEVKESLSHTVWDYYRGEVKNNLNVRITMDELKLAIKKTKTNNKGVDPYGLHPKLLKKFKFNTISICLHLINNAFFMGIWPFDKTIVKFLKKPGKTDYSNPSSWRPISLTSYLGKAVERVIDRRLRSSEILEIDEQQYGFQPGKSTLHYLYKLYHDVTALKNPTVATVYDLEKAFDSVDKTLLLSKLINSDLKGPVLATIQSFLTNRKISIQVNEYIGAPFIPPNGLPQGAVLSPLLFIFFMKGFLQDIDLTYKYADDSTSLSNINNLNPSLDNAENYTYKWRQVLNKDKTEHLNFSKEEVQSQYKFVEKSKILGLWFDRDLSFKTHAAIVSASLTKFWKETSLLITQGLNPFYAVRIFEAYVKPRVTYCMAIWFHRNVTALDKIWWGVHKSIFGIRNYQVSKHVVRVISNIWPPSLLYTNQVLMFTFSTARNADILNPGCLAIVPHHLGIVRSFLVHKLAILNRDPDEIKEIFIQCAKQSSHTTFKKEVDDYCKHLWQQEVNQGLMYSNYSGLKVENGIMKMLAPYPRKVAVKTLRVLINDFEVGEVLYRSKKTKTEICPYCKTVDDMAHFLFSCVLYHEQRSNFILELQNQNIEENLVSLLNCENRHVISALAGFIASIDS